MKENGFVLSGIALLLVLPAFLVSATFLSVVNTGGETTTIQSLSDKISYIAQDIKETVKYMKDSGMSMDNQTLNRLEENYSRHTLIGYLEIKAAPFDIWENVNRYSDSATHVNRASGPRCQFKNLGPNKWLYNFEDIESGDPSADDDYNEPLLSLERLDNGSWKVTIENTYTAGYWSDIWWGEQLLWQNVNREPPGDSMEPDEGRHVGESKIVSGVPSSAIISIEIEDPAGIVHYEENFTID